MKTGETFMKSHTHIPRRSFLKQLGLAGLAAPFVTRGLMAVPPSSVLRHASFGTAGMAGAGLSALTAHKFVKIVAPAHVDSRRSAALKERIPDLNIYED